MKRVKFMIFTACLLPLLIACTRVDIKQKNTLVPATTNEDSRLPQMMVNGIPLHLESFGDISNPIIIFLHGGPGFDYRAMISQRNGEFAHRYPELRNETNLGLSALQDDYFLVFYDRRGSGLSPRFDKGQVRFDDQMNDLDAIIDHFIKEKHAFTGQQEDAVYLFGWSFGGYLATAYINEHPKKVRDLIVYEPRPFNEELFGMMTLTTPFGQLTEDYVDGVITGSTYVINTDHETADYQWAVGASGDFFPEFNNPEVMPFWRVGFQVNKEVEAEVRKAERDVVSNLSAFHGNTLYLYGSLTKRDAIKDGYLEKITSYYPQTNLIEIPDAGHFGPWDQAGLIVNAVRDFVH